MTQLYVISPNVTSMPETPKLKLLGFSLVELLMVLLIISVLSTVAIRSTVDIGYASRYEQTAAHVETVKQAIVGNPNGLINNQPDISGFVADMGRLPRNLHELIEEDFCLTDRTVSDIVTCQALNAGTGVWTDQVSRPLNPDQPSNLFYGWNGPYLDISDNPQGTDAFTDGWGREAQGYCSDPSFTDQTNCEIADVWTSIEADHNYGWYYDITTDAPDIIFFSYGKDHISGGNDFDEDYPSQKPVFTEDWQADISAGIQVSFTAPTMIDTTDRIACIKGGRQWKTNCNLSEAKCTNTPPTTNPTPPLQGIWIQDNGFNFCDIPENDCKAQRGTVNRGGNWKTCHFLSEQSCLLAQGNWREKYTANTESNCNDVTGTAACNDFSRQQCEGANGVWENNRCYTCDITSFAECTASGGHTIPTNTLADTYPSTQASCRNNGGNWDTVSSECYGANFCEFNTRQFCRDTGGHWNDSCFFDYAACEDSTTGGINATFNATALCSSEIPISQAADLAYNEETLILEISYRSNGSIQKAQSSTAVIQENGDKKTILFSGFDNNGSAVTFLPMGIHGLLLTKNYNFGTNTGDIYPASCSGLAGDTDSNLISDCEEAGGTLLENNLCDNITLNECTTGADGTTGVLTRQVKHVAFVPRKSTPIIYW